MHTALSFAVKAAYRAVLHFWQPRETMDLVYCSAEQALSLTSLHVYLASSPACLALNADLPLVLQAAASATPGTTASVMRAAQLAQ